MDAVSEVKGRLNIEDVIGQYVQLKRAGRNFKGLSPFTNEKTPSFMVSPEKQIWHDFSSGRGGDVFSFVMEAEGLDFKAALELLARQAGVDLEQFRSSTSRVNSSFKARASEALELATRFYQTQLTANRAALKYLLKDRGFSKQTLLAWRLGYSPNLGSSLTDFLTKKGFTTDEMKRAGLTFERRRGVGDMFRGRIMIPLADGQGKVIGFTARLLAAELEAPKYINTPQTLLYDKGRHIFGLHLAKESIRKEGFAVVAEGNLDVISSWQAGVANVVASAGTAMTQMHLAQLKRFSSDIRLSFDADRAGVAATERIIPLAQKAGVSLRIITLGGAKDPDELVRKDVKLWQKAIKQAVYAPDWLIERYASELDLKTAPGKRAFTDALLTTIRRLSDPVEQEHYLKKIAGLTDTSFEAVRAKLTATPPDNTAPRRAAKILPAAPNSEVAEYQKLQDHLLAMMFMQPKLRQLIKDFDSAIFSDGPPRQLVNFLKANPRFKGGTEPVRELQAIGDYVKIIALQFEELYQSLAIDDLEEQAVNLKRRLIDKYVKTQKRALAEAMSKSTDSKEIDKLVRQADKLNQLINLPKISD